MRAAVTWRCVCGRDLLVSLAAQEPPASRERWLDAMDEVAKRLDATLVELEDDRFVCPLCGQSHDTGSSLASSIGA